MNWQELSLIYSSIIFIGLVEEDKKFSSVGSSNTPKEIPLLLKWDLWNTNIKTKSDLEQL